MKIMLIFLLLAAVQPLALAGQVESRSATVYLSNEGDYPITLLNTDESSNQLGGYLYKNQPMHWDAGGYFEKTMFICFTFKQPHGKHYEVNSIHMKAITPSEREMYLGGGWNNREEFEVCAEYEDGYERSNSRAKWFIDIKGERGGNKHHAEEGVQIDNITVTLKGFGWTPTR